MTVLDERNAWIDRLTKQVEALTKDNERLRRVGYRDGLLRAAEICRNSDCSDWDQVEIARECAKAIEAESQKIAEK